MFLVAVEHGAQLLLSGVLEVAVELAVLDRVLVYGDMERIAGRTVAVHAKKRVLLRVGKVLVTVKDRLHSVALAQSGAFVLLVVRRHVACKLHKVGRVYRTLYLVPAFLVAVLHSRDQQIVRKRVLFRVRVFAAVTILVKDCQKCLILFVQLVILSFDKILCIYFVIRKRFLDNAVPVCKLINGNSVFECLHRIILTGLAHLLADVEHIPGGVVAGRTDRTADQFTVKILFLNLIQIVVVKQHFAFLACSNRRVIVRVLFFHLVRNGTHSLNSRKHRLGIVNGVPVFVLEPVHVLTQFIKRLCLVRIKALVIIIRPLLRALQ